MGLEFFRVDTFTDKPFTGNPAPVFILPENREEEWMKLVAREMNISETAFLLPREDGSFDLRWFTAATEMELSGHATLACAHILWENGVLGPDDLAQFHTRGGKLVARRKEGWIELDLPAMPEEPVSMPPQLVVALGAVPRYVGSNGFDYLVEVASEETVRELTPNFNRLRRLPNRGVIVTSRADSDKYDFISRFFAPKDGIDEDPFSGSAHCCLGPFWGARLEKKEMMAYQASARSGFARLRLADDRVYLSGKAVTVAKGEIVEGFRLQVEG